MDHQRGDCTFSVRNKDFNIVKEFTNYEDAMTYLKSGLAKDLGYTGSYQKKILVKK
jgi:hypothetical protein